MIFVFILLSLTESLIRIPLNQEVNPLTNFSHSNSSFSLRGLSNTYSVTNYKNTNYYFQVGIGTPPQYFTMLLSLRSPWIFIDQKGCSSCRTSAKKFDKASSSTFASTNKYLTFDTVGPVAGYTGKDTVALGLMTAKTQGILLISDDNGLSDLKWDGVFGLGLNDLNNGQGSIINTLYAQNIINRMIFSIFLNDMNNPSDLPNFGGSELVIDGYDLSCTAEKEFTYIKASNSNGLWQMDFDKVIFDYITYNNGYSTTISSGTSYILGPKEAINGILKRLHDHYSCDEDKNGYLYCECNDDFPDFIFQMSGVRFRIKPSGYFIRDDNICIPTFDYTNVANTWVLGDTFMRRFYTLYDMENTRIGFATVGYTSLISCTNTANSVATSCGNYPDNGSGSSGNGSGSSGNGSGSSGNGSGSSGNGSGSSGNGSGSSGSGSGSSGNGSGSSGNGSGSSGNGSGSSGNGSGSSGNGSGSSGNGSGSSGNGSGSSGNGSGSSGNGSGSSGNGSDSSENGSGSPENGSNSQSSSDNSDRDFEILLALTLSSLAIFMVWVFSIVFLCFKMRESRIIARILEEQRQCRY